MTLKGLLFHKGGKMKGFIASIGILFMITNMQFLTAQEKHPMHQKPVVKRAIAVISPTKGKSVNGTVTFEETDNGVRVIVKLTGLSPGKHGFHIHEFGDISSEDGSSAGGHFNPSGMPHSSPTSEKRHAGDMGNVEADSTGTVHLEYIDKVMKLNGEHSIIGRSIIVHEKVDDLATQPTGNAGARIGFGVIGIAR
jgi:Cu-Zn family superoxide dismutase